MMSQIPYSFSLQIDSFQQIDHHIRDRSHDMTEYQYTLKTVIIDCPTYHGTYENQYNKHIKYIH